MEAEVWAVHRGESLSMDQANNKEVLAASDEGVANWPLWRVALAKLRRREDFGYGMQVEVAWLEKEMSCRRDSSEFAFSMLEMREAIEHEDGFYFGLQTIIESETGLRKEFYNIPSAAEHENVCQNFERKMRRLAGRAVELRNKTLANPEADLTQQQRQKMEKSCEVAAFRTLLLRRERKALGVLRKHAPSLLENSEAA
jgi:hypothetical protein